MECLDTANHANYPELQQGETKWMVEDSYFEGDVKPVYDWDTLPDRKTRKALTPCGSPTETKYPIKSSVAANFRALLSTTTMRLFVLSVELIQLRI